ncbi:MAG: hypothetical protein ACLR0U_27055 [Enterocloster clostridioformis]
MATRDGILLPGRDTKILLEAGISYAWYAGDIGKSEDRNRIVREAAEKFEKSMCLSTMQGWRRK